MVFILTNYSDKGHLEPGKSHPLRPLPSQLVSFDFYSTDIFSIRVRKLLEFFNLEENFDTIKD